MPIISMLNEGRWLRVVRRVRVIRVPPPVSVSPSDALRFLLAGKTIAGAQFATQVSHRSVAIGCECNELCFVRRSGRRTGRPNQKTQMQKSAGEQETKEAPCSQEDESCSVDEKSMLMRRAL